MKETNLADLELPKAILIFQKYEALFKKKYESGSNLNPET